MSKVFLNIPDDIEEIINEYDEEQFFYVYRAIRHRGPLVPKDFYPTFDDVYQKESIEAARNKGGMARIVAEQAELEMDPSYFAVSLSTSKNYVKYKFWRRKKEEYPIIAVGHTDKTKGKAHLDNDNHVSYYLFDYQDKKKNPYNDFEEDESIDE